MTSAAIEVQNRMFEILDEVRVDVTLHIRVKTAESLGTFLKVLSDPYANPFETFDIEMTSVVSEDCDLNEYIYCIGVSHTSGLKHPLVAPFMFVEDRSAHVYKYSSPHFEEFLFEIVKFEHVEPSQTK